MKNNDYSKKLKPYKGKVDPKKFKKPSQGQIDDYRKKHGYEDRKSDGFAERQANESDADADDYAAEEKDGEEVLSTQVEGRNEVLEVIRAGKTIEKLFVQEGISDGTIARILQAVKGTGANVTRVSKDRLDQISESGHHQGVIARTAAYHYSEMEDIFAHAEKKGHAPFVFILDGIEDPHNLGAIIRTANLAGADGVIIPKNRAVGITPTVVKASAGAIEYTPVVKVTNITKTVQDLKDKGLWFVCADMGGETMYRQNLTGPIGLVIGNEGKGVSRLVKEQCDFITSIPMDGDIDSLNASVAAGVLAFEIVRQRMVK